MFTAELLVEEIRKYPCLWDKQHFSYKDVIMKDNRMNSIAAMFHLSKNEVMTKWKGLRDRYLKVRREFRAKQSSGAGSDDVVFPTWKLYKILDGFLGRTVEPRRTFSNITNIDEEAIEINTLNKQATELLNAMAGGDLTFEMDEDLEKETDEAESSTSRGDNTEIQFSTENPGKKVLDTKGETGYSKKPPNAKRKKGNDVDYKIISYLDASTKTLEKTAGKNEISNNDGNALYFKSLLSRYENFNKKDKSKLRFAIVKLFYEAELSD